MEEVCVWGGGWWGGGGGWGGTGAKQFRTHVKVPRTDIPL